MAIEVKVPALGESVSEATVGAWLKAPGDPVADGEAICELETDKVNLEVPAPAAGRLVKQMVAEGDVVAPNAVLAMIEEGAAGAAASPPAAVSAPAPSAPPPAPAPAPSAPPPAPMPAAPAPAPASVPSPGPAARKILAEKGVGPAAAAGTGRDGRVTKADARAAGPAAKPAAGPAAGPAERETRVPMTRLRQTIARRLKQAQETAAMLTTFNEVDMTQVMEFRAAYRDEFERRHGVRLGFMAFFVQACVRALQEIPAVNAEVDDGCIVYKHHYDIGVAVGTPSGLVVPVLRDADRLGMAGIEKGIAELGGRAREGTLAMSDLQGGTFTISNGGVYGSLMSTPILNPPQSGILGMHKIQKRPVEVDGGIELRPMMYLALSYDHRIVDGREAVTFLVHVKEALEDPRRMLLDV